MKVEPWILDTGASDHMSPNAKAMVTYRTADRTVRTADGPACKLEGDGDIPLPYRPGDAELTICLTGVAHASIPQRRHHLISTSALAKEIPQFLQPPWGVVD